MKLYYMYTHVLYIQSNLYGNIKLDLVTSLQ